MPLLTPTRIAGAILALSLFSFFLTFGLPRPIAEPAPPVVDHYSHEHVHTAPIIPRPSIATTITARPTDLPTNASTHAPSNHVPPPATHKITADFCKNAGSASDVMVILRTSKAELANKLPLHLQGLLSCVPNFAIFSDHEGEIDGFPVHDALRSISSEARRTHDEFHEYRLMHADAQHKPDVGRTKDLDKWKFLPMVYETYKLNPHARFYIFIEADTSLSWTNILQWIRRLDYRIPYYSGAPTSISNVQLAQRGPGILISQGALRRYVKSYEELYAAKWEERVGKECCGDMMLAIALNDAHVEFYSAWPMIQGEQPHTLDFNKKHWCAPAVSWHHINGDAQKTLWHVQKEWTQKYGWEKPYLFRDAFESFLAPHIVALKGEWDNSSREGKIVAPQGRQKKLKEEDDRREKHRLEQEQQKGKQTTAIKANMKEQPTISSSDAYNASATHARREEKKKAVDWGKLTELYPEAADSVDRCQKTCETIEDCLQWRYTTYGDGECHLGQVLRLGEKKPQKDSGDKWSSGWLVERVGTVTKTWGCKKVEWGFYQ